MLNKVQIRYLIILLAVGHSSVALDSIVNTELSSTGRLVGQATDILNQLDIVEFDLNHAAYFGNKESLSFDMADENEEALEVAFDDNVYADKNDWHWSDVENQFQNADIQELVVIEAESDGEVIFPPDNTADHRFPLGTAAWNQYFAYKYPLVLIDAQFAGLSIPSQENFPSHITKYATYIAPSAVNSRGFVHAFVCSIGQESTLGNTFRLARNRYYTNQEGNDEELLGLTRYSYTLYGNPNAVMQPPAQSPLDGPCEDISQGLPGTGDDQQLNVLFAFNQPQQIFLANFSFINYTNVWRTEEFRLVLPIVTGAFALPKNAVLKNATMTSYNYPVYFNISRNPVWENSFSEGCFEEAPSFSYTVSENELNLQTVFHFQPIHVLNCTTGEAYAYTEYSISLDVNLSSQTVARDISLPQFTITGNPSSMNISFENLDNEAVEGNVRVISDNKTVAEYEQIPATGIVEIVVSAAEGTTQYLIELDQNSTVQRFGPFGVTAQSILFKPRIPITAQSQETIPITLENLRNESVTVSVDWVLYANNTAHQNGSFIQTLQPGETNTTVSFNNLQKAQAAYNLVVQLVNNRHKHRETAIITTNHPPFISPLPNIILADNATIALPVTITDVENDTLTFTLNNTQFSIQNGIIGYSPTTYGEQHLLLQANDGFLTSEGVLRVLVNQRPSSPIWNSQLPITLYTNQTYLVSWLSSNDTEQTPLTYLIESVQNSQVIVLASIFNATEANLTLPGLQTATTQLQIRALDQYHSSQATIIGSFNVYDTEQLRITRTALGKLGLYDYELNLTLLNRGQTTLNATVFLNESFSNQQSILIESNQSLNLTVPLLFSSLGNFSFTVNAIANYTSATRLVTIQVANEPPIWQPLPTLTFVEDQLLPQPLIDLSSFVSDPEQMPLNLNIQQMITSITTSCHTQTTQVYCTQPLQNEFGTIQVYVVANDSLASSAAELAVTILPVNDPPFLAPFDQQTVVRSNTLQVAANASDIEQDPITLSINNTAWIIYNTTLFWTPTPQDIGQHAFQVTAADQLNSTSQTLSINVQGIKSLTIQEPNVLTHNTSTPLFESIIQNTGDQTLNNTTFTHTIEQNSINSQLTTTLNANQTLIILREETQPIEYNPTYNLTVNAEGISAQHLQQIQLINLSIQSAIIGPSAGQNVLEEYTINHESGIPLHNLNINAATTQTAPLPIREGEHVILLTQRTHYWPQDVQIPVSAESQQHTLTQQTLQYHYSLDPLLTLSPLINIHTTNNTALLETQIINQYNNTQQANFIIQTNQTTHTAQTTLAANQTTILLIQDELGINGTYQATIDLITNNTVIDIRTLTYTATTTYQPPELVVMGPLTGTEGQLYTLITYYYSPDNRTVNITYTPPLNSTAQWQPNYEQSGNYSIAITLNDGIFTTHHPQQLTIANTNRAPTITSTPTTTAHTGRTYQYVITSSDPDNNNTVTNDDTPTSYQLLNGPTGMRIRPRGHLDWNVNLTTGSTATVNIRAVDSQGLYAQQDYDITIR